LAVNYACDINQYAALSDTDGDDVPDEVDTYPHDKDKYSTYHKKYDELMSLNGATESNVDAFLTNITFPDPFTLSDKLDFFGMIGVDITIPLWPGARLFGQFAMNTDPIQDNDQNPAYGFGFAPGIDLSYKIFKARFEYRRFLHEFTANYFNYIYNHQRVVYNEAASRYITKDSQITSQDVNGFFGTFLLDIYILDIGATYELLVPKTGINDATMSFKAEAGVTKRILELIKVISVLKAYYYKTEITMHEDFFAESTSMIYGYMIGVKLGDATSIVWDWRTTYSPDGLGGLKKEMRNSIGTITAF
jgi:hypothetical protein